LREATPKRRDGEAEDAAQEHILDAVDVTEPAAGDHQRCVGDEVDRVIIASICATLACNSVAIMEIATMKASAHLDTQSI